jgi:dTDP-4-amino-4,6-dideoxygalactose transaminase
MFVIRIDPGVAGIERDEFIQQMTERNIGTSVHYIPTHHFSGYRSFASDRLRATDRVSRYIVSLPLFSGMSDGDVADVIDAVKSSISARKQPGVMLAS